MTTIENCAAWGGITRGVTPSLTRRVGSNGGFILVEVLVALVLLAVLIVPLATGMTSALDGARKVRDQAAALADGTARSATLPAWDWGPMVAALHWTAGPAARIEVERGGDPEAVVGLWVDGWFLGEWRPDEYGVLEIPEEEWSTRVGAELMVRVRQSEGAWGPPWRSVVPAEEYEPAVPPVGDGASEGDGATTGRETVVHVPGLANPAVHVLQTDVELEVDPLGLLFDLVPPGVGVYEVLLADVAGASQSWSMEEGRALDLYF